MPVARHASVFATGSINTVFQQFGLNLASILKDHGRQFPVREETTQIPSHPQRKRGNLQLITRNSMSQWHQHFFFFFIGQQHIINPMATDAAWRLNGRPLTFLNTMVYGKSHRNKISRFLIQLLQYLSEKKQLNCNRKRPTTTAYVRIEKVHRNTRAKEGLKVYS